MNSKKIVFSNVAEGTHDGNITYVAGAIIEAPNRLVALSDGKITLADGKVLPFGAVTDEAEKVGDFVNVRLLGGDQTVLLTANSAIEQGALVYSAADGKVSTLPEAPGTYFCVGISLSGVQSDGDIIEVLTTFPRPETVESLGVSDVSETFDEAEADGQSL